jgi:threonine 3-dehydrogenase
VRRPGVLITGASGEIGHGLITQLSENGSTTIVTLDVRALEPALGGLSLHP